MHGKLMRSNRGWPEIRSKSYSNRLLVDFFDPNLLLKSIEIVATIRIRIQISTYRSIYIENNLKTVDLYQKLVEFEPNFGFGSSFFDINRRF